MFAAMLSVGSTGMSFHTWPHDKNFEIPFAFLNTIFFVNYPYIWLYVEDYGEE